jgi:hypothetical protein
MERKVCSKCKEEKEVCEFSKNSSRKDGYHPQCKNCKKEWRLNNREHVLEYHKNYNKKNTDKRNEYYKNRKQSNPEEVSNYHKKYKEQNKEKLVISNKNYRDKNLKKILKYNSEYKKKRRNFDPFYSLTSNIRSRISTFLKLKNISKNNKTFEIVGCNQEFLKEHLEKQFTEGMTWGLMGKHIHIDHIIPLSSAKTEEEVFKLCHYTNLQPLWAEDNLKKSNKIL